MRAWRHPFTRLSRRVKRWSWETTWALAGLFSWVLLPIGVSLVLLPNFQSFYAAMGHLTAVACGSVRSDVGRGQRELWPDHALSRHVARHRCRHRSHADRRHAGSSPYARARRDALHTPAAASSPCRACSWRLIGVAIVSWAGHQKEVQLEGQPTGVQRRTRPAAGRAVRHLLLRHVVRDRCCAANGRRRRSRLASIRSTLRFPAT